MSDTRMKDREWIVADANDGRANSIEHVQVAVLMDIRDELKRLNNLLHCHNFVGIPATLRGIRRAMPLKKKRARKQA